MSAMSFCRSCEGALVLEVESDGGQEITVPDDVLLSCACHFHWQCLLDDASSIAVSLKCPYCDTFLPVNQPGPSTTNTLFQVNSSTPILVQYTNEGGVQTDLDILPSITEEAFLDSNPEARRAKAMHTMCLEGDVEGILDLLKDASEEQVNMGDLIRFQDPLEEMKSALHYAIEGEHETVVWLLLWLSSALAISDFPEGVREQAEAISINRLSTGPESDIRALRNEQGLTAADIAQRTGHLGELLQAGYLRA